MKDMTQSELERERYESRLKAQRDLKAALQDARDEGLAEGAIREIHRWQQALGETPTPAEELRALALNELDQLVAGLQAQTIGRLSRNA